MKKTTMGLAVLTAAAAMTLGTASTAFADWSMENGEWTYRLSSGDYLRDSWQEDGDHKYYLGSDGYMVRSTLLDVNGNYYYVNSSGAMVTNEWRFLENMSWQYGTTPDDACWYYFGSDGRALRSKNGSADVQTIGDKKYIFDEYGRMLTGWISSSAEMLTGADAWKDALYYADAENGDGSILTDSWLHISVEDYDNEFDTQPYYWFYFSSAGKKYTDRQSTLSGKKYYFDENGAAQSGWVEEDSGEWHYYGDEDTCWLHTGWFEAVPDEDMDADGYNDDTSYWFYAASDGDLAVSEMKTIDGDLYSFNEYGEMMTGLMKMVVNDKEIISYEDVYSLDDLPEGDGEWGVYYMDENSGKVRTGITTLELDGELYTYSFKSAGTNKGRGINGIDGSYIYDNGRRLKAESGTKYEVVTYDGTEYLVNTSGVLAKNKKNVTDSDGVYYCTDKDGCVTYKGYDKYTD